MKRLFIGALLGTLATISLASCGNSTTIENDDNKAKDVAIDYSVEVVDIDGETLFSKNMSNKGTTLLADLEASTDVIYTTSEYGTYLKSIAGSTIDKNYFLSIYENGVAASTGIDGLVIDSGDKFKFQVECFNTIAYGGTMDETDVLVDKIIYSYAKKYLSTKITNSSDYTAVGGYSNEAFGSADFWSFICMNLMYEYKDSVGYSPLFKSTELVSDNLKESLVNSLTDDLKPIQLAKLYYAAKNTLNSNNEFMTSFKNKYQTYLNSLPETYNLYDEYTYPFTLSPAKTLGLTSTNLSNLVKTTYRADTTYGIDGLAWEIAGLAEYETLDASELNQFSAKDYGNAVSTALAILPYAAMNKNVRSSEYEKDGKDLVEILIENYYDSNKSFIKYNKDATDVDSFTSQIYASLLAYKYQRDLGTKVSIFA